MSEALYNLGGLRFWSEDELNIREMFINRISFVIKDTLININPSWSFIRTEGPLLIPSKFISEEYTEKDIFSTNHAAFDDYLKLRPETTKSSYLVANKSKNKLPLCVWQVGKSFRRELTDGATASKLRFLEFWQLEFQCIYSNTTKNDYRSKLYPFLVKEIQRITNKSVRIIQSDRLPSYSDSTMDIEVLFNDKYIEVCSLSIRNDYKEDTKVFEIALGLDRIVELSS